MQNQFVEGLDPTALSSVSASQLLQMVRNATPESYIGMVYVGATAPDTLNNPFYGRYLWLDISTPSAPVLKTLVGISWVAYNLQPGSLNGSALVNASVALTKLSLTGATANYLLVVNPTATGYAFKAPSDLFADGGIPIDKLASGTDGYFLKSVSGSGCEWVALAKDDVLKLFTNNKIQPEYLDPTGASDGQVITYSASQAKYIPAAIPTSTIPVPTPIPTQVVFTANGTWTVPAGITKARFKLWGGGGGGGSALGYGGGAGGYTEAVKAVTPNTDYAVVVGAAASAGVDGNDTTVSDPTPTVILTAKGGKSGVASAGHYGAGGAIPTAYTSDMIMIPGGSGGYVTADGSTYYGGHGGNSPMGGQGAPSSITADSNKDGCIPGGGGSSADTLVATAGAGAKGMVIIEY